MVFKRRAHYEYQPNGKQKRINIVRSNVILIIRFRIRKLTKTLSFFQSMFAVTFTANRDSRWLYEILQFLFNHIEELNQTEFASQFKDFLGKMAVRYAEERLFTEDKSIKKYGAIPVYAFNFVDYVLWKNRDELEKEYKNINFDRFQICISSLHRALVSSESKWT